MAWDTGATNLTDQIFATEMGESNSAARIGSAILDPRFTGIVHIAHEVGPAVTPTETGIRYMQYDLNDASIVREVYIEATGAVVDEMRSPGIAYDPVEQKLWCLYWGGQASDHYATGNHRYLYAKYSTDGGANWSPRMLIEDLGDAVAWCSCDGGACRQGMSVNFGWDGSAIACCHADEAPNELVYAWHYSPASGWGTKQTVATLVGAGSTGGRATSVSVGPDGEGVLVCNNPSSTNKPRVFIHTYDPSTETWSSGHQVQEHTSGATDFVKAMFNVPRNEFDVVWWIDPLYVQHVTVSRDFVVGSRKDLGFSGSNGAAATNGSNDVIMDPVGDLHFMHSSGAGVFTHRYWKRSIDDSIATTTLNYYTTGSEKMNEEYNNNLISWGDGIYAFSLASEQGTTDQNDLWTFSDPEALSNNTGVNAMWNGHRDIVGLVSYEAEI